MADGEQERKKQMAIAGVTRSVPSLVVALLEESGEVAPVDFGRFGKRAGQIIARGTAARRSGSRDKDTGGRRAQRGYGAL